MERGLDLKACIFDLDGVIVDTARYHYASWRDLANGLGIEFTSEENENLKGVSRMESLDYILNLGGIALDHKTKEKLAFGKNEQYKLLIQGMDESEILEGVVSLLDELKENGIKIGLGSSSKNAGPILQKLNLTSYFDVIIDGTKTTRSKPDPQVFEMGAEALQISSKQIVVFEDALNGIAAAKAGDFNTIGVGDKNVLGTADFVIPNFTNFSLEKLKGLYI